MVRLPRSHAVGHVLHLGKQGQSMSEDLFKRRGRRTDRRIKGLRPRLAMVAGLLALGGFLAACAPGDGDHAATAVYRLLNSQRNPPLEVLENTVEYGVVEVSRALVHAPQALLVLERSLDRALEQRIVLPNETGVAGENVIHLRAQTSSSVRLTEFSFDELRARFGGVPAPFDRVESQALMSSDDALGSYVYAREEIGTGTTCVLVIRRLPASARPLPRGTQSLDMMMRNCVSGGFEQAMAPVRDGAIATSAAPQRSVLTISPFAAPQR